MIHLFKTCMITAFILGLSKRQRSTVLTLIYW